MSNQLNFSQQMDEVLKTLGDTRPRLLLHACCGPCSSAVLERLCRYFDITVLYYNPNTWPAKEYHRRGEELERFVAAAHPLGVTGFDWFTTTLSISPHKDAKRINAIGQELEQEFGVKHLPSDFKKQNGYLRSLQLSEEYGLYRQDYCGCEFSAKARGIGTTAGE